MATFSFKDHTVKLVRPDAQEKRLYSGTKLGIDPGAKASVMKGFDPRPFGIVYGSADPKWSMDGLSAAEVQDAIEFTGRLYGPEFSISIVIARPGQVSRHLKIIGAAHGEGGNWDADEGSGATGKLGGPLLDILYAKGAAPLKSIYAARSK
jgi:hypothetical protein